MLWLASVKVAALESYDQAFGNGMPSSGTPNQDRITVLDDGNSFIYRYDLQSVLLRLV